MGSKGLKFIAVEPGKARARQAADRKAFTDLVKGFSKAYLAGPQMMGKGTASSEKHYDLFLDPKDLLPLFMEMQRNGGQRRIQMGKYKAPFAGGPRLPHERTLLAEDGETPSLEIRWDIVKKAKGMR